MPGQPPEKGEPTRSPRLSTLNPHQLSTTLNLHPAIARELRIESRRPLNFWLRALGAGAIIAVGAIGHGDAFQSSSELGPELFGNLNAALFLGVVLGAPLLTADCLSRERREGTLNLLFLTPLTATGVVAAKSFVHALRALTVTAAALPVISLAFLFGGSGWKEALLASMHNSVALMLALGAGLVASSHINEARWAGAASVALSSVFTLLSFAFHTVLTIVLQAFQKGGLHWSNLGARLWDVFRNEPLACTGAGGAWTNLTAPMSPTDLSAFMLTTMVFTLVAAGIFAEVVKHAARRLRESVDGISAPRLNAHWLAILTSPMILKETLTRAVDRKLTSNPIGWLHLRTTGARLSKWLWALAVCCGGFYMYSSRVGGTEILALTLSGGMAFAAAGSFHRERESGVMELILVAPLSVSQIMWGRIRGLWAQFLPAVAAIVMVKIIYTLRYFRFEFSVLAYTLPVYLALAPIGLRHSLEARNVVIAWIKAICSALLIPAFVAIASAAALAAFMGRNAPEPTIARALVFCVCLTIIALRSTSLLHQNLRRRDFVIH